MLLTNFLVSLTEGRWVLSLWLYNLTSCLQEPERMMTGSVSARATAVTAVPWYPATQSRLLLGTDQTWTYNTEHCRSDLQHWSLQEWPTRPTYWSDLQKLPTYRTDLKEWPSRLTYRSDLQNWLRGMTIELTLRSDHRSDLQEWPTGVTYRTDWEEWGVLPRHSAGRRRGAGHAVRGSVQCHDTWGSAQAARPPCSTVISLFCLTWNCSLKLDKISPLTSDSHYQQNHSMFLKLSLPGIWRSCQDF